MMAIVTHTEMKIFGVKCRSFVVRTGGALSVHADLSALPGEFLNDMVVDSEGRAYVGYQFEPQKS